jgi:glycerol-3-phosphate acyltransferase PlsX
MKLAIDVMGFENDISEAIKACRKFGKLYKDVQFILVGNQSEIQARLNQKDHFEIVHAPDVVKMDDNPMLAIRKTNSSMYKAIELVQKNQADGVLSAGSSTCYVPMAFVLLQLIKGINKPAFMPYLPSANKKGFMMLDVGANKECTGIDLYQFAKMGNIYSQLIRKIPNPRVGIINIGTEIDKGFLFQKEAYQLIAKDKDINFVGFVEPRELLTGVVDVAVADGYTGNITLKSLEGGLSAIKTTMKKEFKKPWNCFAALCSLGVISALTKTFDYRNNAGAFVIGLQKIAVKTHGNADEQQFTSSIRMLYEAVEKNVIGNIQTSLGKK